MSQSSPVVSRRGFIMLGTAAVVIAHAVTAPTQSASAQVGALAPARPHATLLGVI